MARDPHRFRLARAGVLNVWQYDQQVFEFADGRLLLRGTNGAGKSKTLEMLLPFVLDGDKARMTATGRQGSQLLWLMTDGATATGNRTGYLWVELVRTDLDGVQHVVTCGVGIRHSSSARAVTTWQFTVPTAAPELVEPDGTPLSAPRCRERVAELGGQSFDAPRAYKEHVGRLLFGLEPHAYDDLLRLLYWLRQPQVGEDLDPARLVGMLDEALPALDADAVRQVGEALDELAEHGERVERLAAAADAVAASAGIYARYSAGVLRDRAAAARDAERERAARARAVAQQAAALAVVEDELAAASAAQSTAADALTRARGRVQVLESGPLARNQAVLREKQRRAQELRSTADRTAAGAGRAEDRAKDSRARVERGTAELADAGHRLSASTAATQGQLHACAVAPGLPVAAEPVTQAGALEEGIPSVRRRVTAARAAVGVVREALGDVETGTARRDAAATRAAEAERDEELAAGRYADAQRAAAALAEQWRQDADAWAAEQPELGIVVGAPDPDVLAALPARAREGVTPVLRRLQDGQAAGAARRAAAEEELGRLLRRRREILAERDPAPPAPALPRPGRDPAAGLPLWRLVDVRDDASGDLALAARIEAALQASGLLDAQVRGDGSWRAADDTVLSAAPLAGPTLRDALRPDVPQASPVAADVIERVLSSVALLDRVDGVEGPPAVGRDGSWRLGPLTGRALKPVAQYVGSAAREGERRRRLAEVETAQVAAVAERDAAAWVEQQAAAGAAALRSWLDRLPSPTELRSAWVRSDERRAEQDRARAAASARAERLVAESAELSRAVAVLRRLCGEHDLPADRPGLQARADALAAVEVRLEALAAEAVRLLVAARRLEEDVEGAERDADEAERAQDEARAAARNALQAAEESQALLDTLGADVQRMQAELDQAHREQRTAVRERDEATKRVLFLTERRGQEGTRVVEAERRLAEAEPVVRAAVASVAGLPDVPGLVTAALGRDLSGHERDGLAALGDAPLPRPALHLLGAWADLPVEAPADANAVFRDVSHLAAGPAADHEPRVVEVGDHLAVLARDAAGAEQPLAIVAVRLAAEVARERELLTDRERRLFEEHLLGELGDALRSRQAEARDLVRSMNDLLADVRTSQGIRVRLDWALRDDVGSDVRAAVELLGRPRGSLSPDEGARLRHALSSLIEVQRAAEPEQGYTEHLSRALDYRRWSAFTVRLHRPGATSWTVLTRRTPLSQGEQKVVCYLPLFAAAAAHFTSVAGAAPYAPRIVLLDDAFPKIDVRTHPLLFGLLVDLDLDFVLTSERLWGDHATVPSLAVYEALRAPGERGIAQYRYTWDGHALVGTG